MLVEDDHKKKKKKRTPLVQKHNFPPSIKDKSMPPRGKTEASAQFKKLAVEYGQFPDFFSNLLEKSHFNKSFAPII